MIFVLSERRVQHCTIKKVSSLTKRFLFWPSCFISTKWSSRWTSCLLLAQVVFFWPDKNKGCFFCFRQIILVWNGLQVQVHTHSLRWIIKLIKLKKELTKLKKMTKLTSRESGTAQAPPWTTTTGPFDDISGNSHSPITYCWWRSTLDDIHIYIHI